MKYFKVKIGFGKTDYIRIDETEVAKAIRAQVNGSVALFSEGGSIAGNNILAVLPDWNRVMGYNRDYELNGEDWNEIGKRVDEYRIFIDQIKLTIKEPNRVSLPMNPKLIAEVKGLAESKRVWTSL